MVADSKISAKNHPGKDSLVFSIENLPGMLYRCRNDKDWTMEFVNQGCQELTGYLVEDLLHNQTIAYNEIIHPEDRKQVWDTIQKALKDRQHYQLTYRIVTKEKKVKWVWEKGQGYFSDKHNDLRLEGFISDISEQKFHEWKMEAVTSFGHSTQMASDYKEILSLIMKEFQHFYHPSAQAIGAFLEESNVIRFDSCDGEWHDLCGSLISLDTTTSAGKSWLKREMLIYQGENRQELAAAFNFGNQPCVLVLPLVIRNKITAIIWLGREVPFEEHEMEALKPIGQMAASAIDRIKLFEHTQIQLKRIESLHMIDQAISSLFNQELIFRLILERTRQELGADAASLLLLNPITNQLDWSADIGFRKIDLEKSHIPIGTSIAGEAVFSKKLIQHNNLEKEGITLRERNLEGEGFQSYFAVPVTSSGQVKGVLEIFKQEVFFPDAEWAEYMTALATQAAIAIENYHTFEDLLREKSEMASAVESTLESWSKGLELRDFETTGHTERVVDLTLRLAKKFGIRDEKLTQIQRGAVLHDIGKIGITDEILLKKGELSDEDWSAIKTHPEKAYKLLSPIKLLKESLDIPYCHHEHWDGSGYPRGLKGKDIPLAARIFAVIDTWDALQTDRPYRPGWSEPDTINYLREQAGKQFDPEVVDKFLSLVVKNPK